MFPKYSTQPLELVVSAIHCLREKNGSSPQTILRFLVGKYNVDTETLKLQVQTGLKRGISSGMIRQQSGLYRLNELFSKPFQKKLQKSHKRIKPLRKRKLRHFVGKRGKRKIFKPLAINLQKNKTRKVKKNKNKRKKPKGNMRRFPNDLKSRKQKRTKTKEQRVKPKAEKMKKESPVGKPEGIEEKESSKCVTATEGEAGKAISKT